jgi:methyl-accepting chemotaxis protein
MKIRNKLFIAFALILIFFTTGGAYVAVSVANITQLNELIQVERTIVEAANEFQRGVMLKQSGTYAYLSGNSQEGEKQISEGENLLLNSEATLRSLQEQKIANVTQVKINLMLTGAIHGFEESISTYASFTIQLFEYNNQTYTDEIEQYIQSINLDMAALNDYIENINSEINSHYTEVAAEIGSYSKSTATITIVLVAATVSFAGVIAVIIARRITQPISQLSGIADKVSQGDFSQEINIKTGDEIQSLAESFERMLNAFKITMAMNQENAEESKQL